MTYIHPSWKKRKPDGSSGTPKGSSAHARTKLVEDRKKQYPIERLKELYDRLGSIQSVANATHLNYKYIAKLFDDAGISRKSGWQRGVFTIKGERRTQYGQDAEDEGGFFRTDDRKEIRDILREEGI